MMATQQESLKPVQGLYDALRNRNLEGIIEQHVDQCEVTDVPSGVVIRGKDELRKYFKNWMEAFPDGYGDITHSVVSGDEVVAEVVGHGTHKGVFSLPFGDLPPTGQEVEIRFCQVYEIRDGKIAKARSYYDLLDVIRTINVQPVKRAA